MIREQSERGERFNEGMDLQAMRATSFLARHYQSRLYTTSALYQQEFGIRCCNSLAHNVEQLRNEFLRDRARTFTSMGYYSKALSLLQHLLRPRAVDQDADEAVRVLIDQMESPNAGESSERFKKTVRSDLALTLLHLAEGELPPQAQLRLAEARNQLEPLRWVWPVQNIDRLTAEDLTLARTFALVLFKEDNHRDAKQLLEFIVVNGRTRILGEHHPDTLMAKVDLAIARAHSDDRNESAMGLQDLRQARCTLTAKLGNDHEHVLVATTGLATALGRDDGHLQEAVELLQGVLGHVGERMSFTSDDRARCKTPAERRLEEFSARLRRQERPVPP